MNATAMVGDARSLPIADDSVDLIVTSPPYNAGVLYEGGKSDRLSVGAYKDLARDASIEMERVLKPGGRVFMNVAQALPSDVDKEVLSVDGSRWNPMAIWFSELMRCLLYRDTLVWHQSGADAPTAWGSFGSPNAPNIRGRWEPILVFFKEQWARGRVERNDISPDKFAPWTLNVWNMPCAPRNGHPAPFPRELPRRAILLSTWPGDLVLDPFVGSGTTLVVAKALGRHSIGFDISDEYVELARRNCAQEVLDL